MDKEKIARLFYDFYPWHQIKWEEALQYDKEECYNQAEAVIKALEADVPKELMDITLTPEQITQEYLRYYTKRFHSEAEAHDFVENLNIGAGQAIAKAQLKSPKLAAYIEAQVKAEVDATAKAFIKLMNDRIVAEVQTERERIIKLIAEYEDEKLDVISLLKNIRGGE